MRLIDADKLDWWYKGRPIRRVIDEAPTIDAVEVVRCKDCKNNIREAKWADKDGEHHTVLCLYRKGFKIWHSPDDFCSYGERKAQ